MRSFFGGPIRPALRQAVNFDQADADAAVIARNRGRVSARGEGLIDGRFPRLGGSEAAALDLGLLGVGPIVIRSHECPVRITQVENWITQEIGYASLGERRAQCPNDNVRRFQSAKDESSNENVRARLHKAARAEIRERRRHGLAEIVDFREAETCSVTGPPHDGSVSAGIQISDDRGLRGIARRNGRGPNRFLLIRNDDTAKLGCFPVVVRPDDRASLIMKLEERISQQTSQTRLAERWSDRAEQNFLRARSDDNKTTNRDPIGQAHLKPGRDIQ